MTSAIQDGRAGWLQAVFFHSEISTKKGGFCTCVVVFFGCHSHAEQRRSDSTLCTLEGALTIEYNTMCTQEEAAQAVQGPPRAPPLQLGPGHAQLGLPTLMQENCFSVSSSRAATSAIWAENRAETAVESGTLG